MSLDEMHGAKIDLSCKSRTTIARWSPSTMLSENIPCYNYARSGPLPMFFFFSSRRRHTRSDRDWSSDVCSSDLSACRLEGNQARVLPGLLIFLDVCRLYRPRNRDAGVKRRLPSQLIPNPIRRVRILTHNE